MNTLTQSNEDTRTPKKNGIRIPADCWEELRREAFETRAPMASILARIVREHYHLTADEPQAKTA